jgi:hypothetical protein
MSDYSKVFGKSTKVVTSKKSKKHDIFFNDVSKKKKKKKKKSPSLEKELNRRFGGKKKKGDLAIWYETDASKIGDLLNTNTPPGIYRVNIACMDEFGSNVEYAIENLLVYASFSHVDENNVVLKFAEFLSGQDIYDSIAKSWNITPSEAKAKVESKSTVVTVDMFNTEDIIFDS